MKKSPDQIIQEFYDMEGEFSIDAQLEAESYLKELYRLKKSPKKDTNA